MKGIIFGMKHDRTEIIFIMDNSGSMQHLDR